MNELTKEEAEAYMEELADFELDGVALKQVAGGICYMATCDDHSGPARPHAAV